MLLILYQFFRHLIENRESIMADQKIAVIVGAGAGLSASLARKFTNEGMKVALAARDTGKLADLVEVVRGAAYTCNTSDPASVQALFAAVKADLGVPEVVVFNASQRVRGAITDIDPEEVREAILTTCYGGFLVGQEAAKMMAEAGQGTIMFTGASAGVKGFPKSATFAMGKFGLRGLAQSMARELHPQNIHVVHVVVDGGIRSEERDRVDGRGEDGFLLPDAIADTYYHLHAQHRSAWTWEIEVRPWIENF
jgi:NAD(P)-dependent dehydrogenase (short-subunit alcohol dehydrogenase family)